MEAVTKYLKNQSMNTRHNFRLALIVVFCALISFGLVSRTQSQGASPKDSHRVMWLSRQTIDSAPPPQQISKIENKDGVQMPNLNPDERMSFQTFRNGGWDIYTTPGITEAISPIESMYWYAITPDIRLGGYRTAYAVAGSTFNNQYFPGYQIFSSFSDGFGIERLTAEADNFSPDWSPDASKIAFVSNRTGVQQIYVMSSTGANQTCLSCDSPLPSWSPTWSPAGDQIAFARPVENTNTGKIYVVSSSGGTPRLLNPTGWKYLGNVRWSPDGNWVAFDAALGNGDWNWLIIVNVNTGEARPVLDPGQEYVDMWMGDWSPDGTKLLFTRVEYQVSGNQLQIKNTFIEEVSWLGGQPTRIETGSNTDRNPSVQKRTDFTPPTAQIKNLPEYMHGTQAPMPIAVDVLDEGASGTSADLAELQARKSDSANWVAFENTSSQLMNWIGSKVFFRIRARDHEGNWSAWTTNPNGDIGTTFYSWAVNINPVDYQSHSVSQSAFDFIPKPVDFSTNLYRTSASIKAVVGTSGTQTVTISAPGFNTFTKAVSVTADATFQAYLSPRSNKVINGDFENSLENGWQIAGTRPPERVMSDNYEGQASVNLPPGIFVPEMLPDYIKPSYAYPRNLYASIGEDKATTIVWRDDTNNSFKFLYARKPYGGQWPSVPSQFSRLSGRADRITTVIDQKGGFHFFYLDHGYNISTLNYCYKPVGFLDCQETRMIKTVSNYYLSLDSVLAKVDSSNTLHLLLDFEGIHYQYRTNEGIWSSLEEVVTYTTPILSFEIDPQKSLHLIYSEDGNAQFSAQKILRIRPRAGQWSPPEILPEPCGIGSNLNQVALAAGPNQIEHLFVACNSASSYYVRQSPGSWVKQSNAPGLVKNAMTDELGNVYVYANVSSGDAYYAKQVGKTNWDYIPIQNDNLHKQPAIFQLEQAGHTGAFFSLMEPEYANLNWYFLLFDYRTFLNSITPTLKQVIPISLDMHKTFLSFNYHYLYVAPYLIRPEIKVVVESPSKIISSSITSSVDWNPFTLDVSGFTGQTITLSVYLDTPQVYSFDHIFIDHISLGGWETPTALDVTPTRVQNPEQATTLTITGENFFGAPIVRARNIAANSVTVVNENTIEATWNGTLPVGILNIEVENPGGALAILNGKVLSGNPAFVYLPVLTR